MPTQKKVVIVTGSGGGLGSETARKFGTLGAKVVLNDIHKAQKAIEKLSNEINKGPGESFPYEADVRHYEEIQGMVNATLKRWGRIDALVNFAGGTLDMLTRKDNKLLIDYSEEEWDLVLDVNLKGSFNCIKAVAPQMMKQKDGHIILIASGTGFRPTKRVSSYTAAKAGVFGLMKAAACELGEYHIKVNAINPGLILHKQLPLKESKIAKEIYIKDTMLGRTSAPEDLADLIIFLSQRDNISGQIFSNDSRVLF
jgi:3-oxoacyl-[acyl-carrier protein] reductase